MRIVNGWQASFFGNNTKANIFKARTAGKNKVLIKNVPTEISDADLQRGISSNFPCKHVKRFVKNGSPMPVVTVEFEDKLHYDNVTTNGMDISGVYVFPEPFIEQRRITQCFKCQKFGHISRGCKNDNICSRCSGAHRNINCQLEIKCNGPHPSNCNVSGSFVQVFFFREQSITGEPSNAMLTNDRKTRGVKIAHWNINRVFNKTAPLFSYLKNYHIHVLSLN